MAGSSLSCSAFELQKGPPGHLLGGLGIQAPLSISEQQAQKSHRNLTKTLAAQGLIREER